MNPHGGRVGLSSSIAQVFGLGDPTGPLVAIGSGPSAVHGVWRLATTRVASR
jgi:hypothetical protein